MTRKLAVIGGYARTGTTMLQGLLSESPETTEIMRESIYLRLLIQDYAYIKKDAATGHTADFFDSPEDFKAFHRGLIDTYLDHVESRFGEGKMLIQKQPRMTAVFPDLSELYPEAKFIVMTRDMRDVVASQIVRARRDNPQLQISGDIIRNFVNEYFNAYLTVMKNRAQLGGKLMFVRYEALCTNMAPVMREICDFLEISSDFVSADMNWGFKRPKTDASSSELDGKPVSNQQVGAYKRVLPQEVIDILTDSMPDVHGKLGIDLSPDFEGAGISFDTTDLLAA